MRRLLLLFLLTSILSVSAQVNRSDDLLSPTLRRDFRSAESHKQREFLLLVKDTSEFQKLLQQHHQEHNLKLYRPSQGLAIIYSSFKKLDSLLLRKGVISFVDVVRKPKEELHINGLDRSVNNVTLVHSKYAEINGAGKHISFKERRMDTTDIDLRYKYVPSGFAHPDFTTHASIMATIAAGAGNSSDISKGAAWKSIVSSSDFTSLLPDPDAEYRHLGITVQNHSYGTGIENYYGADAMAYDASMLANTELIHVFSAGNTGDQSPIDGKYVGITAMANLSGSFKMAKNIITVGAVDSFYNIEVRSSKGPAYDGRLKPELVAYGSDGSSGAAAIVSGMAALIQQQYANQWGKPAPSHLVKAVLLNSAKDLDAPGPDFSSGYGNADAAAAMEIVRGGNFRVDSISSNELKSFFITLPPNQREVKVLLCWNDVPAQPNSPKALINDLDISVRSPSNEIFLPWVNDIFPNIQQLKRAASRGIDTLNPVEQVTIMAPVGGVYEIVVKSKMIAGFSKLPFSLVFQMEAANSFEWQYPAIGDKLRQNSTEVIRWKTNLTGFAKLHYRLENDYNWKLISENVDLGKGWFQWQTPDSFSLAELRMEILNSNNVSGLFSLSQRPSLKVGLVCEDSALLYWQRPKGVDSFVIYQLSDSFLQREGIIADSFLIVRLGSATHFSIAPSHHSSNEGLRSFALNVLNQRAGCYVSSLLADLISTNSSRVTLQLGNLYNVSTIFLEKRSGGSFVRFDTINSPSSLLYTRHDNNLTQGINTYRAVVQLSSGVLVYSEPVSLFYFGEKPAIIFPNPLKQEQLLNISAADTDGLEIRIFDQFGRLVLKKQLVNETEQLDCSSLARGVYFYRFFRSGNPENAGRIVVQ